MNAYLPISMTAVIYNIYIAIYFAVESAHYKLACNEYLVNVTISFTACMVFLSISEPIYFF